MLPGTVAAGDTALDYHMRGSFLPIALVFAQMQTQAALISDRPTTGSYASQMNVRIFRPNRPSSLHSNTSSEQACSRGFLLY